MTTIATFDVAIRGDTKQWESSVKSATQTGQSFIRNMAGIAGGFIAANVVMTAFNETLSLGKKMLIDYNARMEQAAIGFTTLLGSAQKADTFIRQLQHFAAVTPFDFPGLQSAANTMLAMGFDLGEIIPTLEAVGDAMAALGRSDSVYVQRIVYDLGQMKQLGRVTNFELRQMAMLGVPVYKILAKAFNTSERAIQEMVAKGLLPADESIRALVKGIEESNMGGMMAAQAKTFNGAMSTIKDSAGQLLGGALKPLFNAIRDGVYQVSLWISNQENLDNAVKWGATRVGAFTNILLKLIGVMKEFTTVLWQGGKDAVSAFSTALDSIIDSVRTFANDLRTGGWNAVVAYANGMYEAARTYLQAVVTTIAQFVSDYLIGSSPPKMGPLSKIYEGGQNVIEAWVQGALSANLAPILDLPKKVAASLSDFEAAGVHVEAIIGGINHQLDLISLNTSKLNLAAEQVKRTYEGQIVALEKQIQLLQDTYSFADKKRDLELQLQKNALQQQMNAAKGDWWAQAQLQNQIDAIDQQIEANRLVEEQQSLQGQIAALPLAEKATQLADAEQAALDPIQAQLDVLEQQRSQLEFQKQAWSLIADDIERVVQAQKASIAAAKSTGASRAGGVGKGAISTAIKPPQSLEIPIDTKYLNAQEEIKKAAETMANTFIESFTNRLKESWPTLLGAAIGAILGSIIPGIGPLFGALVGGSLGTFFSDDIKKFVSTIGRMFDQLGTPGGMEAFVDAIKSTLLGAINWVVTVGLPTALTALGNFLLGIINWVMTNTPLIYAALLNWMTQLYTWIADSLPGALDALMTWLGELVTWFTEVGLPGIVSALLNFTKGLIDWVVPAIPGLLLALGRVLVAIGVWVITKGVPGLLGLAGKLAAGMIKGFVDFIFGTGKQKGLLAQIADWFTQKMIPGLIGLIPQLVDAGYRLATGLGKAFANGVIGLVEWGVNGVIDLLNSLQIHIGGFKIGPLTMPRVDWWGLQLAHLKLPRLEVGAWDVPQMMPALLDKGEMVIPREFASTLRTALAGKTVPSARGIIVNGPLVNIERFDGSDQDVDDLMNKMANRLHLSTMRT